MNMKQKNNFVVSFNKGDRCIEYRNIVADYDWVYDDEDRTYELFAQIDYDENGNATNLAKEIADFIDYAGSKLDMTEDEKKILDIIISYNDWNDVNTIVRMNDLCNEEDDFVQFFKKYNMKIYLNKAL